MCSTNQSANRLAVAASSNSNTGARCMLSPTTAHFTPPDSAMTFIPRLYEATSVPSVVASGT